GWQGHGGGPSFTGGTFGNADWRSDSPYFEEAGINRGYYEDAPGSSGGRRGEWHSAASRSARRYPQGPKGYQRSDERLREDISERLMHSHHIDSSDVTVQVSGGKVLLEGTVPDRYMKHEIENICDAAPGVQDIENRLRVRRPESAEGASRSVEATSRSTENASAAGAGGVRGARKDS
ncbi:MAG: BON domain-containing protein, partial [Sinobacteraceae bacterium]|nr:BON domain-containing protein [Nevskiaceae bacterium]